MALNGQYRCKKVIIRKYDSVGDPVSGYPNNYNMVDGTSFTYDGAAVTDNQIANLLDGSVGDVGTWNDLVNEFRGWVEFQEANLNIQSQQINVPYGTDLVTCPIALGDYF